MPSGENDVPLPPEIRDVFQLFTEVNITQNLVNTLLLKVIPHDLSVAQFSLMNHLLRNGGPKKTIQELARVFQVSKASMGGVVQRLEGKGFVRIEKTASDARQKIVVVTDLGEQARDDTIKAVAPLIAKIIDGVGMEQLAAALETIKPVRHWIDENRDLSAD